MKKTKIYRYLGRNGIITSPVLINDTNPIIMFALTAEDNKILTNGTKKTHNILVFEDEVSDWYEIDNIGQE